ncbi:MAG: sugar ABC transporter permease [Actinomycetales bacterium]|nr:sugar ABC transporter permease [Actinomycetales bacterium]
MATTTAATAAATGKTRRRRRSVFSRSDKIVLGFLIGVPTFIVIALVWVPTMLSIILSFTSWNGIGGISRIKFVGLRNYEQIFTIYPAFWSAVRNNILWLVVLLLIATPLGMLLAYLLDKGLRGSLFYQTAFFMPVVLSLAVIGIIWQFMYAPELGLINNVLGKTAPSDQIDWLGNSNLNIWAALVASSWRHVGYIMMIYLAGLKGVDVSLREAAALDGASEWQAFRKVIFPAMRPVNVVVLVITIIEALRAFDLVFIINGGRNGLELLSVLVYDNIVGEASRIGYGSAIAVILLLISIGPIMYYLINAFRKENA